MAQCRRTYHFIFHKYKTRRFTHLQTRIQRMSESYEEFSNEISNNLEEVEKQMSSARKAVLQVPVSVTI